MANGAASNIIPLHEERQPFYAPDFELRVHGERAPVSVVRDVMEVRYEDGTERIDAFSLTVNNWDTVTRRPIYFGRMPGDPVPPEPNLFNPGNELQLFLGYTGDLRLMMTGFITSVDVQFPETGPSKLVVSGLNILDRFRRQQYTWSWPDDGSKSIRDSDVALALAPEPNQAQHRPGLGIEVRTDLEAAARETPHDNIYMNNQFPIVFLMERARKCGYEVLVGEERLASGQIQRYLYFGRTQSLRNITYVLEWGKSLVSFHPSFSSAQQIFAAKVCGWDRTAKKRIEVRRTLDDLTGTACPNPDHVAVARIANREDVITDPPARTEAEARNRADALLTSRQGRMVEATGTTVGLPDLRAGRSVLIHGTGEHFDGQYTVISSTHILNETGYRTSFSARRVEPKPKQAQK